MNIQTGQNDLIKRILSQKKVNINVSDVTGWFYATGSVVMPTEELLMCDFNHYKLTMMDSYDVLIDTLKLGAHPWDISVVDAKTTVVTL